MLASPLGLSPQGPAAAVPASRKEAKAQAWRHACQRAKSDGTLGIATYRGARFAREAAPMKACPPCPSSALAHTT
eukprot:10237324-Alexandrium_andersonii.AAC.1